MPIVPRLAFVILILVTSPLASVQAQNKSLRFIHDFPVKIDGGCNFFLDRNIKIKGQKAQLIIDGRHEAFIEFAPNKWAFFEFIKREKSVGGYTEYYKGTKKGNDYFKGKIGSFILKIDSIRKDSNNVTIKTGTLFMNYPGFKTVLKIHGSDS